jgi:hypothetical protein
MKKAGRDAGLFCALWGRTHSLTGPQVRPQSLRGQLRCPSRLKSPPQADSDTGCAQYKKKAAHHERPEQDVD